MRPTAAASGPGATRAGRCFRFSHNFRTPQVQQASLNLEREVAHRLAVGVSYMYVHGVDLIRARDVNLPPPVNVRIRCTTPSGTNFLGTYDNVDSFSNWQPTQTLTCPFPPCINPLARPIPQLGSINVFESSASSVYHGADAFGSPPNDQRRLFHAGLHFRACHRRRPGRAGGGASRHRAEFVRAKFGKRAQRHRSAAALRVLLGAAPKPFHRDHEWLGRFFNNWKASGVFTYGSGRPVSATRDWRCESGWQQQQRPSARTIGRNALRRTGLCHHRHADLAPISMPVTGSKLELMAESFNLLNRDNQRVQITQDGFLSNSAPVRADR